MVRPEEIFGVNAGKVWEALRGEDGLTAKEIAQKTGLKITEVYAALGWLGREGKIEIIKNRKRLRFRLLE
ncbi:MAG: hypothetical protein B6U95_00615 [Thermofilum sp. ex4484_82]|nr:winged helix-turn-helix domain-containing protein [Thermoproteales archaeon]OYT30307.1 MAG: hypothetical protein B6U95_00615 [Thermofilum sp. ex4484_82]OYT39911.1 MAG: hypothetical protein B6U96_00620 [Archaeoglobales archaeon ex4484_92]RLE73584.1 MAG: hypothetical protein DRZ80_06065 [Thermoprotei archaeon]RLE75239.1 MAG: hypothetical protein DRJ44_06155 [Thermoprotei archaeon]